MDIKDHLDDETITTIKSTVDFLAKHGADITGLFYKKLFAVHPELKNMFSSTHQDKGEQQQALAQAVYGFAAHLDDLDAMAEQISRIAHKHTSLSVQADQYPIVGKYLLQAIHQVVSDKLDKDAADTITNAWEKGYGVLANMLINFEKSLYQKSAQQPGGWEGLREFSVVERKKESQDITSFYLEPIDGKSLPGFRPGQYISLYIKPDNAQYQQIRQYSLSDAHRDGFYRISVKREGYISKYIHDKWETGSRVMLSPPAGDFVLQENTNTPVVLLSAGVGVTPMMSVLNTVLEQTDSQKITFVHAVKNSQLHPFKQFVEQVSNHHTERFDHIVFYENPLDTDRDNKDYNYQGMINLETIEDKILHENADYYLCGPLPFMATIHKKLTLWGVQSGNIHYEVFGADKALY